MRITDIHIDRVGIPLDPPFCPSWDPSPRQDFEATLVTVETDGGIVGHGSGDTMDAFEQYKHLFVGEPLMCIQRHVRVLETITFHNGRYWPLESAIWDAIGKSLGVSVAALFGGATDALPAYASTGAVMSPQQRAESALAIRERGFKAMKVRVPQADLALGIRTVSAVRDAVGDSLELMVDLNQSWRMPGDARRSLDTTDAQRFLDACAELDVFWLEEPLPLDDVAGLATLRNRGVRIAGGEMVRTLPELLALMDSDALDVYQPDVVLAVGMERSRLVAGLAQARHRHFTPHTWSNGYGLMANLHVSAGLGGGPFIEFPYDPPTWSEQRRDFLLAEPVLIDADGMLRVPAGPGLGISPNPDLFSHRLRGPS